MRLNSRDFIAFFIKYHTEFIISEEKTIQDKIDEKRMKIYATYERVQTTIVAESMPHFQV